MSFSVDGFGRCESLVDNGSANSRASCNTKSADVCTLKSCATNDRKTAFVATQMSSVVSGAYKYSAI